MSEVRAQEMCERTKVTLCLLKVTSLTEIMPNMLNKLTVLSVTNFLVVYDSISINVKWLYFVLIFLPVNLAAGVIDQDYRGNVGVILFNFGNEDFQGKLSE